MQFFLKKFTIFQNKETFKIGTDSILIGAWANVGNTKSILDIGAGSGILGFMLAQRSKAEITFIEKNKYAFESILINIKSYPFENKFFTIKNDFFKEPFYKKFDLIICNPPYFTNSKLSIKHEDARHQTNFELSSFFEKTYNILVLQGKLNLVFPFNLLQNLLILAFSNGFYLSKKCEVKHATESKPSLVLLEFSKTVSTTLYQTLEIKSSEESYTEEYKKLTQPYLIFDS
jgi:tRNA1Val (adenine37-N6)-methyltransferase